MVQEKFVVIKAEDMYERYIKRLLDILLSLTALILLFPIMVVLSVIIRLWIGNPVVFVQERPGKDEKIFRLRKFRTMTNDTGMDGKLLPDCDRLTVLGRTLRKTSLDELPELWNILIGDMSFIGPRPLLVSYLPYYSNEERKRHCVRPGLTGLAQISGRNALSWDDRLKADVQYVQDITFKQDFRIFWMTVFQVLRIGKGVSDDTAKTEGNFAQIRQAQTECKGVVQR